MSDTEDTGELNSDDVMKILVATDIHLGYNEKHSLRGTANYTIKYNTSCYLLGFGLRKRQFYCVRGNFAECREERG